MVDAWEHPDSDKLFVESINVGEASPRQIVSGLRAHYALAELLGRRCLVVCNLPKAKLAGTDSYGMAGAIRWFPLVERIFQCSSRSRQQSVYTFLVLCAVSADGLRVELLQPPAQAAPGARVFFPAPGGGLGLRAGATPALAPALTASQVKKRKAWPAFAADLAVSGGVATWRGMPMCVVGTGGACTASAILEGAVS